MMISLRSAVLLLASLRVAFAAQSLSFVPPSKSPSKPSPNYVGKTNYTLPSSHFVKGIAFDQIIVIVFENTNYEDAASTKAFQNMAAQGVTFSEYHGLIHPSQPNYVGMGAGYTFGLESDDQVYAPPNVSTIVDILEEKGLSWASYQENMPCNGYIGHTYSSFNYLTGSGGNSFYQRKHSQLVIFNSTNQNPRRASCMRNLNDFAADLEAGTLPQVAFITPNIDNDAHDTGVDFGGQFLDYFLTPLLKDERFNTPKTLIFITFDENENGPENNRVFSMAVGGAVPPVLHGTVDPTYLTHYTVLSTVQLNWGLNCLGRQDTNKTMNNVLGFVAEKAGYKNTVVTDIPLTNGSVRFTGPLNTDPTLQTPWLAPDKKGKCVSPSGKVFVNNNPPINEDFFVLGQCPQVAYSTKGSLQWSTALDAEIIAEQRKFLNPTVLIDPSELKKEDSN